MAESWEDVAGSTGLIEEHVRAFDVRVHDRRAARVQEEQAVGDVPKDLQVHRAKYFVRT